MKQHTQMGKRLSDKGNGSDWNNNNCSKNDINGQVLGRENLSPLTAESYTDTDSSGGGGAYLVVPFRNFIAPLFEPVM